MFILGLAALLLPVNFERRTLRFDLPAMMVAALTLYVLARGGVLSVTDGIVLVLGGEAYTGGSSTPADVTRSRSSRRNPLRRRRSAARASFAWSSGS